jgi:filamentous hemagglutinin family protein
MGERTTWRRSSSLIQAIGVWMLGCVGVQAEIQTDGTLGPARQLQGPDFQIPENLGTRAGANLFHSFRTFNVHQGESASFTGSADIANVVSRVTGGEGSRIDGLLRSQIGTAGFYFINPAGVTFGPNAKVDVPASFHVSTADELQFNDGQVFSASDPGASSLSIATPDAFGFGGGRAARITVDRSELVTAPESTLDLVAGDLRLQGANLQSRAGEVRLIARGERAGEEPVSGEVGTTLRSGQLEISDSKIYVTGTGGGYLGVAAESVILSESQLVNANTGSLAATQGTDVQAERLEMSGASIQNISFGAEAGPLNVRMGDRLQLASGARLLSATVGTAQAPDLNVTAEELRIVDGAGILNWTLSTGKAGPVFVDTGRLMIDGLGSESFTGIASQAISGSEGDAGEVQVQVNDRLDLVDGAVISSDTFAMGNAGAVSVKADQMAVDGRGSLLLTGVAGIAAPGSKGDAGKVQVEVAGQLELVDGAVISSDTMGTGNAGAVNVKAGRLSIDRQGCASVTRIASHANPGSEGDAGEVWVWVEDRLELLNGAEISSGTSAKGNAGSVLVQAGQMRIDGQGDGLFTGIGSQANLYSTGNAGDVQVQVNGDLALLNGAVISGNSFGEGSGGSVSVEASRLSIDGQGSEFITGITSQANAGSGGDAGDVKVHVKGELALVNGGLISSDTFSRGNAGSVSVAAGQLTADGQGSNYFTGIASQANPGSEGNAGEVRVQVADHLGLFSGAVISSNTFATGQAGNVSVKAGQLIADEQGRGFLTGIASLAGQGSEGDAGRVQVEVADRLDLLNAGVITTGTFGKGDAGTIKITAGQLTVDGQASESFTGIASRANAGSQGSTGDVEIVADRVRLLNDGQISIEAGNLLQEENLAEHESGLIRIDAQDIELADGARITARSTGNVPAAAIDIRVGSGMKLTGSSRITTEAVQADGGPISITGASLLLQNGLITTSVEQAGDGGDIRIRSDALIMDTGFIQANTGASGASGGDILVDTPQLIATFGRLEVGGEQRRVFEPDSGINVIQAAAPDGVSGNVRLTAPVVDVTGALFGLETGFGGIAAVGESPCKVEPGAQPSSLTRGGHGGIPAGASEPMSLSWTRRIDGHRDNENPGDWSSGEAKETDHFGRQARRPNPGCG